MGSVTNYALSWDANLKTIQQCQLEAQRETDGMARTSFWGKRAAIRGRLAVGSVGHGEHPPNPAEDDELCAMFDGRGSSRCTIVLPAECLGYGLVVPFLAYRFALWFRIMKI
eukprot:scaffold100942_cov56-Phaeocystis_antarctica.AAC.1